MDIELVKKAQKAFEWYDKAVDNSIDYLNLEREEQQDAWNALDKLFEAVARQSETEMITCPNCGGSGVYQEYDDEYDRYHVYACYKCEGTGEIARQSVKSDEVSDAIEVLECIYPSQKEIVTGEYPQVADALDLAITALQAYQPWIPVSERLPMNSIPVLVTYIGFSDGKPYSDGVAKWSIELNAYNGGWAWTIDGSDVTVEITHWKPLPEPPKEVE